MSTRCEEVTDRLMELLYQELPADERGVLEAHVEGCERCRAELASFQRTRALARAALDIPAPAGVRQRLVAAAVSQAAAARGATAAQATAPVAAASASPAASDEGGGGLWKKVRGRWTFPTLATLGAMAVFLLTSRVFLNQETTVERGRRVTEPASEPLVEGQAPPPASAPLEQPRPAAPPSAQERKAAEVEEQARSAVGAAAQERSPRKPTPFPGVADERDQAPEGLGGVRRRSAKVTRGGSAAPKTVYDSPALEPPQSAPAARPAKGSLDDLLDSSLTAKGKSSVPPPPPPAVAAAPPPPAAAGARPARAEAESVSASAAPSDVGAESVGNRRAKRLQPLSESVRSARSDSDGAASESVDELSERAERLFKEGRWSDAVTIFDRLLRRYPKSAQAPHWRQRLTAARTELNAAEPMP